MKTFDDCACGMCIGNLASSPQCGKVELTAYDTGGDPIYVIGDLYTDLAPGPPEIDPLSLASEAHAKFIDDMYMIPTCACGLCTGNFGGPGKCTAGYDKDSGEPVYKKPIRQFPTGATRDTSDGKHEPARFMDAKVIKSYNAYMHKNRIQKDGSLRDPDNWKKGIPIRAYMDSLMRHVLDMWEIHDYGEAIRPENNQPVDIEETLNAIIFNAHGWLYEYLNRDPNV